MTINGPAPTILAMFFNTAIDQQVEKLGQRTPRPTTELAEIKAQNPVGGARHGAGRHPQGRPGPEHLHLLHRVLAQGDGRHPAVLHRATRCSNFYSVSISGYHIAEAGANPISPARLHARQRLHLRRGLPRARHEDRRLRAEPVVLLLLRHGPGVHGARPRGAAHLGGGDEEPLRRQRAQPEAQVPLADLGPLAARAGDRVQRHPHHAAGADLDLRQHQLAAHQRLRRGDHHADRGIGAPRDGDPADHQPRVGPGEEREPEPGLVRRSRSSPTWSRRRC